MKPFEYVVTLASAWYPRGELSRFQRLYAPISEVYSRLVISLPPEVDVALVDNLRQVGGEVDAVVTNDWSWGRYIAVQKALETNPDYIHYVDFDRLLRWVETRPAEWREVVRALTHVDCLIVGRSEAAYHTHPQALVRTEAISNLVISEIVGKQMDVSAGSKGFSRKAAEYILSNCAPGHALGTDGEWPVVLKRGGFAIDYIEVQGLDWEIADNYQPSAADGTHQKKVAQEYDSNPQHWARRVEVAHEIVQAGLEAARREISDFG